MVVVVKLVTTRDIYNVKTKHRTAAGDDALQAVTDLFQAVPGSALTLQHDDNDTDCLQTPYMQQMCTAIIYDGRYEANQLQFAFAHTTYS